MGKVKVGLIVAYWPTKSELKDIKTGNNDELPAIITNVNKDKSVNLKVILDCKGELAVKNKSHGHKVGNWNYI